MALPSSTSWRRGQALSVEEARELLERVGGAMNTMSHRGYTARVEYDERDNIFVGRIIPVLTQDIGIERIPSPLRQFQFLKEDSPEEAGRRVAEVMEETASA